MADPVLDQIIAQVYTLLTGDPKTNGVDWQKGRFTPYELMKWPAGGISFAPGQPLEPVTIPNGWQGIVTVRIMVWSGKHDGIGAAEQAVTSWFGKVVDVLVTAKTLNVASLSTKPYLKAIVPQAFDSNPEATPPFAEMDISAEYVVRM